MHLEHLPPKMYSTFFLYWPSTLHLYRSLLGKVPLGCRQTNFNGPTHHFPRLIPFSKRSLTIGLASKPAHPNINFCFTPALDPLWPCCCSPQWRMLSIHWSCPRGRCDRAESHDVRRNRPLGRTHQRAANPQTACSPACNRLKKDCMGSTSSHWLSSISSGCLSHHH